MCNTTFWNGKRIFITGHTGFKGSWLTLWLSSLGAKVIGYAKDIPTDPSLFEISHLKNDVPFIKGDIRNYDHLLQSVRKYSPEIIFHLAAQPLVRKSYCEPLLTYETNIMGTVHILEAARNSSSVKIVINVTSDKCYKNNEMGRPFIESDPMGGTDPYSASKACAELVAESYIKSYLHTSSQRLASVRAGNVIGGGDWAEDRLIPDFIRSLQGGMPLAIRNPHSIRPWQHVLDPLHGYIVLAEKMWKGDHYNGGWNFGPCKDTWSTVDELINTMNGYWEKGIEINYDESMQTYEAQQLQLDSSKANQVLGWRPKLSTQESVIWTAEWYKQYLLKENMRDFTLNQIKQFQKREGA